MDSSCFILLFILAVCTYVEMVVVKVENGMLRGTLNELSSRDGFFHSFKGIPYAEPPVGKLRFLSPVPHKPWAGIRNAIKHCSRCIQYDRIARKYPKDISEDCLCLNVYTPELYPAESLPVIIFIHGGAFKFGSGNDDTYGPDYLIKKKVVVVTINYRLDSLGFLKLDTSEVPGNAGLRDQWLALKWVNENIHHFGGDPQKITLMGESAGSASVTYHMMSPMSEGLFQRAIAQSGVPFCEWAISYKLFERSIEFGLNLGSNTTNPKKVLAHLQTLPAIELVNQSPIVEDRELNWHFGLKMTSFQPAPEKDLGHERFLVEPVVDTLKRGNVTPVDVLIGFTSEEALILVPEIVTDNLIQKYNDMPELFVPREILLYGDGTPEKSLLLQTKIHDAYFGSGNLNVHDMDKLISYFSDELFVYNINRFVRHLPEHMRKYLYQFATVSSRNQFTILGAPFGLTGVSHTDDLRYIFKTNSPFDNDVTQLVDQTVTLIANFAKHGNPTPDCCSPAGIIWPEYNNVDKAYMDINTTLSIGNDVESAVNNFWRQIYEKGLIELP